MKAHANPKRLLLPAAVIAAVSGCGGGGSPVASPSPGTTLQPGLISTRFRSLTSAAPVTVGSYGAVVTGMGGADLQMLDANIAAGSLSGAAQNQQLVGPQGLLAASAAGFIAAQQGKNITSALVFDAATRASSAVTVPQDGNGQTNLVFNISADSLTLLSYLNGGANSTPTIVIQPPQQTGGATVVVGQNPPGTSRQTGGAPLQSAAGALVSFSAADGTVAAVIPYGAPQSTARAVSSRAEGEDGALLYRGRFLAVFDGAGRNLAPGGAATVRIDARTGRVVSAGK